MTRKSTVPIKRQILTKMQLKGLEALRTFALERRAPSSTETPVPRISRCKQSIPMTGKPASGLMIAEVSRPMKSHTLDPVYKVRRTDDGEVHIPLDGEPHLAARIGSSDYEHLTARSGVNLTRARWYRDDDGMVRAFSRNDSPMVEGLLVAALLARAQDGDTLTIKDPLFLRRTSIVVSRYSSG